MRGSNLAPCALLMVACGSAAPPPAATGSPQVAVTPAADRDFGRYQKTYPWPADWPQAFDAVGKPVHGARVAKQEGGRQIVVVDSASALAGHEDNLEGSVIAFGSHCGMNVAEMVVAVKPLAVIGNDAGVGLHSAGIVCIPLADTAGIPAATVSADSAYIGVAMSLWTTGRISVVNKAAEALGVKVGMPAHEAADILLARAGGAPGMRKNAVDPDQVHAR